MARGRYIAILGADDVMLPARIAKQFDHLEAHPELGFCGTWFRAFGAAERTCEFPTSDEGIRGSMLLYMPLSRGTCMIRRSVLERSVLRCRKD